MRIQLSNGKYIDPCNPCLLYDTPIEPQPKITKETQSQKEHCKIEERLSQLESHIEELRRTDSHCKGE